MNYCLNESFWEKLKVCKLGIVIKSKSLKIKIKTTNSMKVRCFGD
jgi:hypothetical protein